MTYTWQNALDETSRLLGDPARATWDAERLLDGYNAALVALSSRLAVASASGWTGDGTTAIIPLPDNVLHESNVFLYSAVDLEWWEPIYVSAGALQPDIPAGSSSSDKFYYQFPDGYLNLGHAPASGEVMTLYYFAYWDTVYRITDVIAVPRWAREALRYYTAAYVMEADAVGASDLGQYDQDQDSGNPEHNPWEKRIRMMRKRYDELLSAQSFQDRSFAHVSRAY